MSDRTDRFQAAVLLAHTILEEDEGDDPLMLQQALDDIMDEVRAGRRNQAEFHTHALHAYELLREWGYPIKTPLKLVGEENR